MAKTLLIMGSVLVPAATTGVYIVISRELQFQSVHLYDWICAALSSVIGVFLLCAAIDNHFLRLYSILIYIMVLPISLLMFELWLVGVLYGAWL